VHDVVYAKLLWLLVNCCVTDEEISGCPAKLFGKTFSLNASCQVGMLMAYYSGLTGSMMKLSSVIEMHSNGKR